MKQSALEPGILQVLKFLTVIQVLAVVATRNPIRTAMGIEMPPERWLVVALTVPLFLVVFTWIPWWHRILGRIYVPLTLAIASINFVVEKYLTTAWFTSPADQEVQLILLVVKLWLNMLLIMVVVAWQYSAGWTFFISLAFSAADVILSLPFMKPGTPLFPLTNFLFLVRLFTVTFVALLVQWLVHRQRTQRFALAEANRKLAHYAAATELLAVSQERNRMARELHDTLAHSLSGVIVQLEAAEALWDVNLGRARKMVEHVHESARSGLTEVRRALNSLRASPLEDLGLALAISDLAESVAARTEMKLDLDVADRIENIPPEVEQCVYRVAQEALANVARHSKANSLLVSLIRPNGHLVLNIKDDGQGFDIHKVDDTRYGLKGLRERAEMIGGALHIESKLHHGTTVRLSVLLPEVEK